MEPVEDLVKVYLRERGDEFQIDEVMEFSNHFYVIIQEVDTEINAFELLVDRYTGRISSEPGPNMMWNQKYSQR